MYIQNVTLHTPILDAQHRFYTETLGFPLVDATDKQFTLQTGASTLTLIETTASPIYHLAFNVPEHQFDAVMAWTQARVPVLPHEGKPYLDFSDSSWNAHSVYFEDAAGNVLEFIARHRLKAPNAPAEFSAAHSIHNISEIGLAAEDLPALVAHLQTYLDLPVFSGDPTTGFCALGDDHGLLITVTTGRNWLPTDNRPSGLSPLDVTIHGEAHRTLDLPGVPYTLHTDPTAAGPTS